MSGSTSLEKVLGLATDRMNEVAPLIASMLSIPLDQRYPALNLSPAQQRRQTLSALLDQMEGLAQQTAGADAVRGRPLGRCDLARSARSRGRTRAATAGAAADHVPARIRGAVEGLARCRHDCARPPRSVQAETLVELVTGGRRLPAEVLAQIVAKTDGVPLFVEELTKNRSRIGLLIEDSDRYRLNGPLPPLAIPSTLQDSLMARLDRLGAVKEIAQIGAAIGREFSYPLLHAVVGHDEPTLRGRTRPA